MAAGLVSFEHIVRMQFYGEADYHLYSTTVATLPEFASEHRAACYSAAVPDGAAAAPTAIYLYMFIFYMGATVSVVAAAIISQKHACASRNDICVCHCVHPWWLVQPRVHWLNAWCPVPSWWLGDFDLPHVSRGHGDRAV